MDEFNFKDKFDMSSSVSKIKKKNNDNINMINLIKDLEYRLDNIENSQNESNIQIIEEPIYKEKIKKKNNKQINYKVIIIYMFIFFLLNNCYIVTLIYKLPYITQSNPYPNLIIRTLLFGLFVFLYKRYIK